MINVGLIIMGVGMLVVFAFLTIMVISMRFMSGLILKFFPEKEEPVPVRAKAAPAGDDAELAVAIAAAYTIK
jgi:oxaloacetate decarboxylase gamma subunit